MGPNCSEGQRRDGHAVLPNVSFTPTPRVIFKSLQDHFSLPLVRIDFLKFMAPEL